MDGGESDRLLAERKPGGLIVRGLIFLLVIGVLAAGVALLWPRLESEAPTLSGPESIALSAKGERVSLGWADEGTGLRELQAFLETPAGAEAPQIVELHSKTVRGTGLSGPILPVARESVEVEISPAARGLAEGQATLVLQARDWSWSNWGGGNRSELRIPVVIDATPPSMSVSSGLTYIRRGGAAAVRYLTDPDAARSGVRIGPAFFPGMPLDSGNPGESISVFAIPIDAAENPVVEVVAVDAVGNESTASFDVRVQERSFPETNIALNSRFLDTVGQRLGKASGMSGATSLATFQRVNSELREKNEATISAAIPKPSPKQWTGAFEQMKNSSVTSKFAELRHYTSAGTRVSRARHYGFDLASTARAPITASNAGTVVFAGDNGIYGNLVLIDHGLGLTSLYGHLSSLAVQVGERVAQGQTLGQSGATGLAGGDHLHFAILVGRTYVDPVEWWDPKWVREHIEVRLPEVAGGAGGTGPDGEVAVR